MSQLLLPRRKTLTKVVMGGFGIVCGDDRDRGNCQGKQEVTDNGVEKNILLDEGWAMGTRWVGACSFLIW